MAIAPQSLFEEYKQLLFSLPDLEEKTLKSPQFLLERDEKKKLEVYYAPFDYVNEKARVVLAGITPGWYQMRQSFSAIKNADPGLSNEDLLHEVKKQASFSGPLRKNLVTMLNGLDLHSYLGIASTEDLFGSANDLVHNVSVLSYPVFYKGKNYSGSTPKMLKTEILRNYITDHFAKEMAMLDQPLIIPLGVNVSSAVEFLAETGSIDPARILRGFPHPSGGNGHRHRVYAENKESMKEQIERYFSHYPAK